MCELTAYAYPNWLTKVYVQRYPFHQLQEYPTHHMCTDRVNERVGNVRPCVPFHPVYHALLVAPHPENVARPGCSIDRIYIAPSHTQKTRLHFNQGIFKRARRRARSATTVCHFHFLAKTATGPLDSTRPSDSTAGADDSFQPRARARRPSPAAPPMETDRACGTPLNHQSVRIYNSQPQPDACTGLILDRYRHPVRTTRCRPRLFGRRRHACRDFGVS